MVILFAAVVGLLTFQATRQKSSLVMEPNDLVAAKSQGKDLLHIRVGGRVAPEAIEYQTSPLLLKFAIHDKESPAGTVQVVYSGVKPDMFEAGRDVLVDGDFKAGVFAATKLLTQCPSKYEPPAPKKPE